MNAEPAEPKKNKKDRVDWTDEEIKQIATQVARRRLKDIGPSLRALVIGAMAQLPKDRQRQFQSVPTYLKDEVRHYIQEELKAIVPPSLPIKLEELNEHELQTQLELIINKLTPDTALRSIHDCFSTQELLIGCDTKDLVQHVLNKLVDFAGKLDKLTSLPTNKPTKDTVFQPPTPPDKTDYSLPESITKQAPRKPKVAIDGFKNDQIQQIQSAIHDKFTVFSLRKSGVDETSAPLGHIKDAEVYIVNVKFTRHSNYAAIKDHSNKTGKHFIEHRGGTSSLIQQLRELKLNATV